MGEVYKYGHCNIAATKSTNDVDEGIYVNRNPIMIIPLMVENASGRWYGTTESKQCCVNRVLRDCDYVNTAALNLRGWVLQERVMSPRTLHFGHDQIVFECCESKASEMWPGAVSIQLPSNSSGLKVQQAKLQNVDGVDRIPYPHKKSFRYPNGFEYWENVVKYYSDTNLTVSTDRLVAISGIMKSIQQKIGADYIAGLWNYRIEYQLLWKIVREKQCKRPAEYVAPTWSWASVQGQVEGLTQHWIILQHTSCITVLDVNVQPVADAFGQVVEGGYIKMRGQLTTGRAGYKSKWEARSESHSWVGNLTMVFDTSDEVPKEEIYWLPLLYMHPVSRHSRILRRPDNAHGLVLLLADRKKGEFRRCGVFDSSYHSKSQRALQKALKRSALDAETSGLPYEKTVRGNEFIITII
jgi:ligand-binding SRPBCC domain-containing protein